MADFTVAAHVDTFLKSASALTARAAIAAAPFAISSNTYFPEDFGAVGDRVTDDSQALQDCTDAVKANGGGIIRLSSLYGLNAGFIIDSGYIEIQGWNGGSYDGVGTPVVYPSCGFYTLGASTVCITVQESSSALCCRGLSFRDFTITGPTSYSGSTTVGIDFKRITTLPADCQMIFNINFQYLNIGLRDETSDSMSIIGCRVCNNSTGIKVKNSINWRIVDCIIYDCLVMGINIEGGYGNVLGNNSIGRSKVDVQAFAYQSLSIVGNTFNNDDSIAIVKERCLYMIGQGTTSTNLIISGNTFVQTNSSTSPNNKWAFDIIGLLDAWNANISGNTFRYANSTRPVIYVTRCRGLSITSNYFASDTVLPLFVESSATTDRLVFDDSNIYSGTVTINNISQIAPPGYRRECKSIASKTAAYTATSADYTISCDATSAAFTVTLPAAASVENHGRIYVIKKTDASVNAVTVDANASETIDGATTYSLLTQWKSVTIQSNGTNWLVLGAV